jgi:hypothetical protein
VLPVGALAGIALPTLQRCSLVTHVAARWTWCDDTPAWTIWSRNRIDEPGDESGDHAVIDEPIDWQPEGALLTRPGYSVMHCPLGRAGVAFLDTCAASGTVETAALAALGADPATDLATLVRDLLDAGAFSALLPASRSDVHLPPTEDTRE